MHVEIVLREGPIRIASLAKAGLDAWHQLWDGITASERFPAGAESANYVVTLTKAAFEPDQVLGIESDLVRALRILATAWPFAGGSFMVIETREFTRSPRFESNAQAVRDQLLAEKGLHYVSATTVAAYESGATYRKPPLGDAAGIAGATHTNPGLRRLLEYHQGAWMAYYHVPRKEREAAWFVNLYKVREVLTGMHGGTAAAVIQQLQINNTDWDYFGRVLNNNDLRHAELTGVAPDIPSHEVDRLFRLARDWSSGELCFLGLPTS